MKALGFIYLLVFAFHPVFSQADVSFSSSDTTLQTAFYRAKKLALHYKGKPGDPIGPWYESALPPRSAFCMRDVAHQCIAAEVLGLSAANKNMFTAFVKNISESKDWCSYWEINKSGKPAPEDYRNDTAFWYNLNANFDILNACWRLYLWTGDKDYIQGPAFKYFHDRTANEYISSWVLQPDSLLSRPAHPNASASFNIKDDFHRCRGLPSYSEGVQDMKMGIDLVAALYRGLLSYAAILKTEGENTKAKLFEQKAVSYQEHIDKYWWDEVSDRYNTYYSNTSEFGKNEGETFLLWFDALRDTARKHKTIARMLTDNWNVENMSYFPYIFYKSGYWNDALHYILLLADPGTKRHEYPEVSYGIILGFVQGLMGIEPDARFNRIATIYKANNIDVCSLNNVPLLGTLVSVNHTLNKSEFMNTGKHAVIWRPEFYGSKNTITVNGKPRKANNGNDDAGKLISWVDIKVGPGQKAIATIY